MSDESNKEELEASFLRVLRRLEDARTSSEAEVRELTARLDQLLDILVGKDLLNEGHRRLITRVGEGAGRAAPPRVHLRTFVDKYQIEGADIDCASRISLCRARCCSFTFDLTKQDLDEGKVRWEIEDPYRIRHENDGFCTHLDRDSRGCSVHAHRPATCRSFDCRGDTRIWIDFEARIPTP